MGSNQGKLANYEYATGWSTLSESGNYPIGTTLPPIVTPGPSWVQLMQDEYRRRWNAEVAEVEKAKAEVDALNRRWLAVSATSGSVIVNVAPDATVEVGDAEDDVDETCDGGCCECCECATCTPGAQLRGLIRELAFETRRDMSGGYSACRVCGRDAHKARVRDEDAILHEEGCGAAVALRLKMDERRQLVVRGR